MDERVTAVELLESEVLGEDGFLQLRRCRARNVRANGTRSRAYAVDAVLRRCGLDAVAVVAYARNPDRLLLRRGLRPVLRLGRPGEPQSAAVPLAPLYLLEVVAGILELQDVGSEGIRRRAAIELLEETGLRVVPETIGTLGPPAYLSSGVMAERIFFCAVETTLSPRNSATGDGTPMEEGGEAVVLELCEALERCNDGRICDVKTECIIRRLAAHLG